MTAHGQAFVQTPQPMHSFSSTLRAPVLLSALMAPFGHASAQGTGCGHCLQVSTCMRKSPALPSAIPASAPFEAPKFLATLTRARYELAAPSLNSLHASSQRLQATQRAISWSRTPLESDMMGVLSAAANGTRPNMVTANMPAPVMLVILTKSRRLILPVAVSAPVSSPISRSGAGCWD